MTWLRGLVAIAAMSMAWWLAACVHPGGAAPSVSGTATYRERIALPADAVFEAFLEEVPRADAPAAVVASVRVPSAKVPIAFTIAYDPGRGSAAAGRPGGARPASR